MDEREAAELVKIEGRLMAEYGATLGTDAVIRCMADAVGHFDEAPVRTYVLFAGRTLSDRTITRRGEPSR